MLVSHTPSVRPCCESETSPVWLACRQPLRRHNKEGFRGNPQFQPVILTSSNRKSTDLSGAAPALPLIDSKCYKQFSDQFWESGRVLVGWCHPPRHHVERMRFRAPRGRTEQRQNGSVVRENSFRRSGIILGSQEAVAVLVVVADRQDCLWGGSRDPPGRARCRRVL